MKILILSLTVLIVPAQAKYRLWHPDFMTKNREGEWIEYKPSQKALAVFDLDNDGELNEDERKLARETILTILNNK